MKYQYFCSRNLSDNLTFQIEYRKEFSFNYMKIFLDRKAMADFAKKYGLVWTQVETRIMNERKAHKQDVPTTAKAMEIDL